MGHPAPLGYLNSKEPDARKYSPAPSPFTRIPQVRASDLALRHRDLIVAMMHRNRFGDELWMSTKSIAVVMGRKCHRKKAGKDTLGRKLGPCTEAHRRTVQRLIDELVYCRECGSSSNAHPEGHAFVPRVHGGGVLEEVYPANSRVRYRGHLEFRRSATYRLNAYKLVPRLTYEEYRDSRPVTQPKGPQRVNAPQSPPSAKPVAPVTPIKPATAEKTSRMTRAERKALVRVWEGLLNKKQASLRVAPAAAIATATASRPSISPDRDPWLRILRALESKVNRHSFDTWLRPTRYDHTNGKVLFVRVPTAEFSHAGEKYAELIQESIAHLGLGFDDVKFVTPEFVALPQAPLLTREQVREVLAQACKLLSTSARSFPIDDAIVALRIEGYEVEESE